MKLSLKRIYAGFAILAITIFLFCILLFLLGARINNSKSLALGLYWTINQPIEKGAYVIFCPPDTSAFAIAKERGYISGGYCPGGYGQMMKRILAAKGDAVSVTGAGVLVNDQLLAFSKPYSSDPAGRPLPQTSDFYTLKENELLLMTDVSATSFDARYFGPIDKAQIKSVIRPILTW